jgi:hypothetical protein
MSHVSILHRWRPDFVQCVGESFWAHLGEEVSTKVFSITYALANGEYKALSGLGVGRSQGFLLSAAKWAIAFALAIRAEASKASRNVLFKGAERQSRTSSRLRRLDRFR